MKNSTVSALTLALLLSVAPIAAYANEDGDQVMSNDAQLDVRITGLEEQMRMLNGKLEESQFQNRKLAEELERFKRDAEFRLNDITAQQQAAAAAPNPAPAAAPEPEPAERKALTGNKVEVKDKATGATASKTLTDDAKPAKLPEPAPAAAKAAAATPSPAQQPSGQEFATPRDHYNHAFRLLNQTKYDEAASSFKSFLKKNPKDPLAGNANYWLGETFYIKKDYVSAADNFRQGYESAPTGPKAADNLLKLGMSLDGLKQPKQACVVLSQVVSKFEKTAGNTAKKAEAEQKRIGCQ